MSRLGRAPVLVVVVGALVAGLVVDRDRTDGAAVPATFGQAQVRPMPVAAPPEAVSSSWYCPGVPGPEFPSRSGNVEILNVGDTTVDAVVRAYPSDPGVPVPPERVESVAPGALVSVRLAEMVTSDMVAAVVEVVGGDVVVEQTVLTSLGGDAVGADTTACASEASGEWHMADGVTTVGAELTYTVLNPFPDDAVVDVSLSTDEGAVDIEAVVVPGRSMRTIDVGNEGQRRRAQVAGSVVARSGRVVVGRLQTFDGDEASGGRRGVASTLGSPSPGASFAFGPTDKADGVTSGLVVYNPGDVEAVAQVDLLPVGGVDPAVGPPEPLEVTVPGGRAVQLDLTAEDVVAPGRYAMVVRSVNDVPFVAERVVALGTPAGAAGRSVTVGSRLTAARWYLAVGGTLDGTAGERVDVVNPGTEAVVVTITTAGGAADADLGLTGVELPGLMSATFELNQVVQAEPLSLVVEASGPVVVERILSRAGRVGVSRALGVPAEPVQAP